MKNKILVGVFIIGCIALDGVLSPLWGIAT